MGLRTIQLIGLIAGVLVMWESPLVEAANDQNVKKDNGPLRRRIPPGIVLPLPYVYPEYVDPREQKTPSKTQDNRAPESVSEIILDSVRKTISASKTMEKFRPKEHQRKRPIKMVVQEKNQHALSLNSDDNNQMMDVNNKETINSKPVEEIKRPVGRRPMRFGTRHRTLHSTKQNFAKIITTTAAPITNEDSNNESKEDSIDNKPISNQSTPRTVSSEVPVHGTRNDNDVAIRKRPLSTARRTVIRRTRPNGENSKMVVRTMRRRRPVKVDSALSDDEVEQKKPNKRAETGDDSDTIRN